jgi:threonine synthase
MVTDRSSRSKASPASRLPSGPSTADDVEMPSPRLDDATLRCRECGRDAPPDGPQYCGWCFGPIEVVLPEVGVERRGLLVRIGAGPPSLARYEPLLPPGLVLSGQGAGWTPLRRAAALGRELGLDDLWLKVETANPTGSFKDRVVEVAAARALRMGQRVFACSSTGNLARAVSGAAALRGLPSVVLVPESLDPAEVRDLAMRGATVIAVRGGYDGASRLAAEAAADHDQWAWINVTLRPWYELGGRTLGFEIAEQLEWQQPDRLALPMASGALARAVHDAAVHLVATGLTPGPVPHLTVLQPSGCAGVATAFARGATEPDPIRTPTTVAPSLAMGDPPDGAAVLAAARATGGAVSEVPEDAVLAAADLVRRLEGVPVEPAGGVVVAGLAQLRERGALDPAERIVAVMTGAPPRAWSGSTGHEVVPGEGLAGTIEPSVSALTELLPPELRR